ncbi:MAG TPA: polysaccharide biosynthesis/export family protein [Chitinophagaceae bacterium]
MKFVRILSLFVLPVYLISCSTQKKTPYYLDNVVDTTGKEEVKIPELQIQKNDLLSIQVYSISTKPDISDAIYNLPAGSSGAQTGGFLVDAYGNIEYPRLGTFHAEGLTKQELAAEIKKRLTQPVELLKDPTVIIRFLNYKITILGPVGHEGVVTVTGERLTILEAIGLAGGITDYGKRNNVKIIREINGKREIGIIDLTSKDLFASPYYNLAQNDIVMVEPTKQKLKQAEQSLVAQRITFAMSLITAAAFIYNIFK